MAFSVQSPNELGPLVETEKGFHLFRLKLRQAGLNHSLESVRERIESRLMADLRGLLRHYLRASISESGMG